MQKNTTTRISIHAAGTVVSAAILAWLFGTLGAKLGLQSDPTGWQQLAFAVVGMLLGIVLGTFVSALVIGRVMQMRGSWLGALLGMVVGAAGLFSAMRMGSESPIGIILGVGCVFLCVLVGYHAPWRTK